VVKGCSQPVVQDSRRLAIGHPRNQRHRLLANPRRAMFPWPQAQDPIQRTVVASSLNHLTSPQPNPTEASEHVQGTHLHLLHPPPQPPQRLLLQFPTGRQQQPAPCFLHPPCHLCLHFAQSRPSLRYTDGDRDLHGRHRLASFACSTVSLSPFSPPAVTPRIQTSTPSCALRPEPLSFP
jgi:hypothetical protein